MLDGTGGTGCLIFAGHALVKVFIYVSLVAITAETTKTLGPP
jgi:hypothetical protein